MLKTIIRDLGWGGFGVTASVEVSEKVAKTVTSERIPFYDLPIVHLTETYYITASDSFWFMGAVFMAMGLLDRWLSLSEKWDKRKRRKKNG